MVIAMFEIQKQKKLLFQKNFLIGYFQYKHCFEYVISYFKIYTSKFAKAENFCEKVYLHGDNFQNKTS